MAQMIPRTLDALPMVTRGERKTFNLLANLPDHWYVWFDMGIGTSEVYPDFIILDPETGIFILEVKDWSLKNIQSLSRERISIKTSGVMGSRMDKNPILRAREYSLQTIRLLQKEKLLVHPTGNYKGKLTFAWGYGCVFSNMSRSKFNSFSMEDVSFESIIDPKLILFKEDFKMKQEKLLARTKELLGAPFKPKPLSKAQFYLVRKVISPDTVIPDRTLTIKQGEEKIIMDASLDPPQETLSKSIGEGHRLLSGVAGSGKTLIMLYRAKLISKLHPDWRVLFLCWNISLGTYLKQMFDSIAIEGKFENTHVFHFVGWVRHIYEKNGWCFPQLTGTDDDKILLESIDRLLEHSVSDYDQYQAVFIDDAQDFVQEFFLAAKKYLDEKTNSLLICSDEAQNVMGRSWRSLGIQITKQRTVDLEKELGGIQDEYSLQTNYRNTAEIMTFATWLYDRKLPKRKLDDTLTDTKKVGRYLRSGPRPELVIMTHREGEVYSTAAWIKNFSKEETPTRGNYLVV